jgi:ABC-type dipeptide/oligopeptide/nickel transport system permease subunit
MLPLVPILVFVLIALVGPLLGRDPETQDLLDRLSPPVWIGGSWEAPLGTDGLGRDILARVMHGARLSLVIGVIAAGGSAVIGTVVGLIAGANRGVVDALLTTVVEVLLSIPTIVVGIVVTTMIGQSLPNLLLVLMVFGWISYARVVRLQSRQLLAADFVRASIAIGANRRWVMRRHLLPNVLPVFLVLLCQQVAAVMLWEASLTYLGVGLPVDRISLGGMIRDGQVAIFTGWWVSVLPGGMIVLAVLGFNLLADWLQQRLDPTRRHGRMIT